MTSRACRSVSRRHLEIHSYFRKMRDDDQLAIDLNHRLIKSKRKSKRFDARNKLKENRISITSDSHALILNVAGDEDDDDEIAYFTVR